MVLAHQVEGPLRGQGKEKPMRGQQDRVGDGPLRISSLGGMCLVLVLMVTLQPFLASSDPGGISMPTAKLYELLATLMCGIMLPTSQCCCHAP